MGAAGLVVGNVVVGRREEGDEKGKKTRGGGGEGEGEGDISGVGLSQGYRDGEGGIIDGVEMDEEIIRREEGEEVDVDVDKSDGRVRE